MDTRALSFTLRRLSSAWALSLSILVTGCCGPWSEPESISVATEAELVAIAHVDESDVWITVSDAGEAVVLESSSRRLGPWLVAREPVVLSDAPLHDVHVSGSRAWAVGAGARLFESLDGGQTWDSLTVPTTADLHAVLWFRSFDSTPSRELLAVAGQEFLALLELESGEWFEPEAPPEGWGELHALGTFYEFDPAGVIDERQGVYAATRGSRVVHATEPFGPWDEAIAPVDQIIEVTLEGDFEVIGDDGQRMVRDLDGAWTRVESGIDEELVAVHERFVLTASGAMRVFDSGAQLVDFDERATALWTGTHAAIAVGAQGLVEYSTVPECEG